MPIIVTSGGGNHEKKLPFEGLHEARCLKVIYFGKILNKFGKTLPKLGITWELVDEKTTFGNDTEEKPFVVSKTYAMFLDEGSNLRKDLESWRGKKFTEKEAEGFDVGALVNAPCMINILIDGEGDKRKPKISSITSAHPKIPVGKLTGSPFEWSVSNFDQKIFDTFPQWMKDEITSSEEYRNSKLSSVGKREAIPQEDGDDDLPF